MIKLYQKPSEWRHHLSNGNLSSHFGTIYSPDYDLAKKLKMLDSLLESFQANFGDEPCLLSRAPGRLNIMGRHIDHQGGHGNMIALDRDVYLAVGIRSRDRKVRVRSVLSHQFQPEDFVIDELLDGNSAGDWAHFVDSDFVRAYNVKHRKQWSIYLKSIIARFQAAYPNTALKGMDICAAGDVPIAAGLSSSSTLVVALAEAISEINHIRLTNQQFVELCGEGEWYVGTRGGAGDHAAMKYAQKNKVVQIRFFPLGRTTAVEFPRNYSMVICNSKINAKKTAQAGDTFNQRVACYHFGKAILRQLLGEKRNPGIHLRDYSPEKLVMSFADFKRLLTKLPCSATFQELESLLESDRIDEIVSRFGKSESTYPIREVVIYGLSECERSRKTPQLFQQRQYKRFGRWMNISHNGDRVFFPKENQLSYSDADLQTLMDGRTSLAEIPGAYGCSLSTIDKMVDIALQSPGVLGAQISGAGLGGCIMVLVKNECCHELYETMSRNYYHLHGMEADLITSRPVSGSGLICLE